jgi:hypothetical protein
MLEEKGERSYGNILLKEIKINFLFLWEKISRN